MAAVIALTAGMAGGALAQSEEAPGKTSHDVAVLKSEINRLQQVIGSLDQQIGTLGDTLAAVEARLAETEGRLAPSAPLPSSADCGAREHGSVFVGKPLGCYYGYWIYQCWNGEIRMLGGECEAATQ